MVLGVGNLLLKGHIGFRKRNAVNSLLLEFFAVWNSTPAGNFLHPFFVALVIKVTYTQSLGQGHSDLELRFRLPDRLYDFL